MNYDSCTKKDKKICNKICVFMGFRTKLTCYCMLDSKLCMPYIQSKQITEEIVVENAFL